MQFEPNMSPAFSIIFLLFLIPLVLIMVAVQILVFCKIFSKTGFSWALGLLMLVPIVSIVMLLVLAFAEWPIERELRSFRQQSQVA